MGSHCYIGGKCVDDGAHKQVRRGRSMVDDPCLKCTVSANTGEYSAVAGCNLDMDNFAICVRRPRTTTGTGRRGGKAWLWARWGGSCLGGKAGCRNGPPKAPRTECVIMVVGIRGFACPTW